MKNVPDPNNRPDRGSTTDRGYGADWRRIRNLFIQTHLVCELCADRFAQHVHHIDHNTRNNDYDNLQSLCVKCHHLVHSKRT